MSAPVASKIRKAQQAEHRDKGEVVDVGGVSGLREHRLELQVAQSQSRRLGRHVRASHVLSRGVFEHTIYDAGSIEPGQYRQTSGDRGRLEAPDLLHPSQVQLDVRSLRFERREAMLDAPVEVRAEVGCRVDTGLALVAGEASSDGQPQDRIIERAGH